MATVNFSEKKAEKDGVVTPKSLIEHLLQEIYKGNINNIVYSAIDKDGVIKAGHSDSEATQVIGMLECAKQDIIDDMRY